MNRVIVFSFLAILLCADAQWWGYGYYPWMGYGMGYGYYDPFMYSGGWFGKKKRSVGTKTAPNVDETQHTFEPKNKPLK